MVDPYSKNSLNGNVGSSSDQCYIKNHAVMNHVIKGSRCTILDLTGVYSRYLYSDQEFLGMLTGFNEFEFTKT